MTPDVSTPDGCKMVKDACESTIRKALQRGSGLHTVTQHPQEAIEDCKIMLACLDEIDRLRAWIARTADDANLNRKAGYHGRRVKLEAMAILCGKPVPAAIRDAPPDGAVKGVPHNPEIYEVG